MTAQTEPVVIVGGGFAGLTLALHLLADPGGPAVVLVDRSGRPGRGVAYGTEDPRHLLNVRAGAMGAFPDRPEEFLAWLRGPGGAPETGADDFVQRRLYGDYLRDLLGAARRDHPGRLRVLEEEVLAVRRSGAGVVAWLADGRAVVGRACVLALGTLSPAAPLPVDVGVLSHPRYIGDPWRPQALTGVEPGDTVFLLGTGLSMVDVVLTLNGRGWRGTATALSRHGLLPRPHTGGPESPVPPPALPSSLAAALQVFRRSVRAGVDWRSAFDGLRPLTQGAWAALSPADKGRFLRHLRPYWDVHRHRLPPQAAEEIAELAWCARFAAVAGRLVDLQPHGTRLAATWRPRGTKGVERVAAADWFVNCVGPTANIGASASPLLRQLLAEGLARPAALGLGIDTDGQDQVLDAQGRSDARLTAIGALNRGRLWQVTSVPDLRVRAASVAARLLETPDRLEYLRHNSPEPRATVR